MRLCDLCRSESPVYDMMDVSSISSVKTNKFTEVNLSTKHLSQHLILDLAIHDHAGHSRQLSHN